MSRDHSGRPHRPPSLSPVCAQLSQGREGEPANESVPPRNLCRLGSSGIRAFCHLACTFGSAATPNWMSGWVTKQASRSYKRLHCLDDFEQLLTNLINYLDEEARDHAVQQHVGEEAAAHLGGHSHAGRTERPRLVRAPNVGPWGQIALCLRYVPNPGGWYA